MRIRNTRSGVALGLTLALLGSLGSAVGFSSPPVGEQSHPVFTPRQKRCVGNPPRQTEDPLSPPCVAFFDGDNGGATWQGVTGGSILIALYNDLGIEGDLTMPWVPEDEAVGHQASMNGEQTNLRLTAKTLTKYFADRFHTYGRRVQLFAVPSSGGITSGCGMRRIDAAVLHHDFEPFAVITLGDGMDCFTEELSTFGVPTFSAARDIDRATFHRKPGLAWGFHGSRQQDAEASAAFICDTLAGERARFAPGGQLARTERRFGLTFSRNSPRGPGSILSAQHLLRELGERCGLTPQNNAIVVRPFSSADGKTEAAQIMADFRFSGVTTVICYCVPVATEYSVIAMQAAATAIGYRPEWYWDTASRMFRSAWHRRGSLHLPGSIGITPDFDGGALESRYPYRAFASMRTGKEPNQRFLDDLYHAMLLGFTALQVAGPELTPGNVAVGLEQLALRTGLASQADGGFETSKAVNRFTFRDRYLPWVWDPRGREPGMSASTGCLRLAGEPFSTQQASRISDDGLCMGAPVRVGTGSRIL